MAWHDLWFDSNAAPCAEVLAALAAAADADSPYDDDRLSRSLDATLSDLFGTEVDALWVTSGTAANGIAVASATAPGDGVLWHAFAHLHRDEAGAPEFFGHGVKLRPLDTPDAKLTPAAVARACADPTSIHKVRARLVSIANLTELGTAYRPDEVAAIGAAARAADLLFHVDGARFANAVAHCGCRPADLTWRAGVDVLSFGFAKNGGMMAELLICFRRDLADRARTARKRAGHLPAKGRFIAAQILTLLRDDLWLRHAAAANAKARRAAAGLESRLLAPVEGNILWIAATPEEIADLRARGLAFHTEPGCARFALSYDRDEAEVARLNQALRDLR